MANKKTEKAAEPTVVDTRVTALLLALNDKKWSLVKAELNKWMGAVSGSLLLQALTSPDCTTTIQEAAEHVRNP